MNVHFIGELKGANHLQCPNLSCHYIIVLDTHSGKIEPPWCKVVRAAGEIARSWLG